MPLTAFTGAWTLDRVVEDRRDARHARFAGRAVLSPAPHLSGALAYREEGRLVLDGAVPLAAAREYLWVGAGGVIEVRFPDGRPFHRFDPREPAPGAAHDCPPDRYEGRYDLQAWPLWRVEWRVTGPRKDMVIASTYRPAGAG